jgi:acetyltransferase-like isoleucine patch superfamily enzyme
MLARLLSFLGNRVVVRGEGTVRIGRGVRFDTSVARIELHALRGGEIVLDEDVWVESGVSIEASSSVRIGARTRIAPFAKIIDTHFHALAGNRHDRPTPSPVIVEEDVFIGPRAVLLPRAHIGRGSVLRAGTVITRRFPPGAIVGGVPAAVHGRLSTEEARWR